MGIIDMLKKLRAGGDQAADALRKALADTEAQMPAAARAHDEARADRARLLLEGDDKQVLAAEAKADAARIEIDRLNAAAAELRSRLGEAEEREESQRIDTLVRDADRAAEQAAVQLRARYEPAAREVAALLDRMEQADALVREARAASLAAGRPFAVRDVSERLTVEGMTFVPFAESVSLRPVGRFPGWGRARRFFESAGFTPELANPLSR